MTYNSLVMPKYFGPFNFSKIFHASAPNPKFQIMLKIPNAKPIRESGIVVLQYY